MTLDEISYRELSTEIEWLWGAFAAVFVNACIGILLGLIAGFYGGKTDRIVMRIVET